MNIVAIFVAATVAFIIAFLWNGPVFGKLALRLSALDPASQKPPKASQIILNYIVFLVTATIMSGVFWIAFASSLMGEQTWYRGMIIALWLWLGFNLTATFIDVIWKGKNWKVWLFEAVSAFVIFAIMGAILGSF